MAEDGRDGLALEDLVVSLDGRPLVAVNMVIAPGVAATVMGPSGIGKSSLLAAITGTLDPAFGISGRIRLDGRDITRLPTEARRIGVLFQDELLFAHLSVGGNLGFGLPSRAGGRAARRALIEASLARVGLAGYADRDPATLSGGERARVALMRMLLSEPRALLLDEAFSRLDAALRDQTRQLVFDLARARALPVLQVTHDPSDAQAAGGAILRIDTRARAETRRSPGARNRQD